MNFSSSSSIVYYVNKKNQCYLSTNDSRRHWFADPFLFVSFSFPPLWSVSSIEFFLVRIVRNRGSLNDNSKLNHHHPNSSPTTSTETSITTTTGPTTPHVVNSTTSNEDDSRTHATGVSASPNGYSIHSLLNHSQYSLHSHEYSTKRSHHHHHHHGSRPSHHIRKRPLVKLSKMMN